MRSSIDVVKEVKVRVGSTYSDKGGKIYYVRQIINHGGSSGDNFDFDFALLELSKGIEFNYHTIEAIPLPNMHDSVLEDEMCFVSGWGQYTVFSSGASKIPKKLRGVEIPIVSNAKCEQALSIYGLHVTKQMLCAGDYKEDCKNVNYNSNLNEVIVCFILQLVVVIAVVHSFAAHLTVNESCLVLCHGDKVVDCRILQAFMGAFNLFVFGLR